MRREREILNKQSSCNRISVDLNQLINISWPRPILVDPFHLTSTYISWPISVNLDLYQLVHVRRPWPTSIDSYKLTQISRLISVGKLFVCGLALGKTFVSRCRLCSKLIKSLIKVCPVAAALRSPLPDLHAWESQARLQRTHRKSKQKKREELARLTQNTRLQR